MEEDDKMQNETKDKEEKEMEMKEKVKEQVSEKINDIIQEGINGGNIGVLGQLVDIHKDLSNEDYWKVKEEKYKMNFNRGYGEGGYPEGGYGNYGRRGVPGSGRGRGRGRYSNGNYGGPEEVMQDIHEGLQEYMEGKEQFNRGNYGAKEDTIESLDCMMQAVVEFVEKLNEEASSPEEMKIIKKYTKEISNM